MSSVWQRTPFSPHPLERKSWRWREAEQECSQRFMARGEIDYACHWPWCALGICPPPDSSACYTYTHTQYGPLHSKQKLLETASRLFWAKLHPSRHLNCKQAHFLSFDIRIILKKHLGSVSAGQRRVLFLPCVLWAVMGALYLLWLREVIGCWWMGAVGWPRRTGLLDSHVMQQVCVCNSAHGAERQLEQH